MEDIAFILFLFDQYQDCKEINIPFPYKTTNIMIDKS